jgi:hypothetical protein
MACWFASRYAAVRELGYTTLGTPASLAVSTGAHITVVQKLLEHKSAVLILDTYGPLFPDDLDAAAAFDAAAGDPPAVAPPTCCRG